MNRKELKTIKEAAERFMKGCKVTLIENVSNSIRIELPLLSCDNTLLYFFTIKRKNQHRFSLIIPTESVGLIPTEGTLVILQSLIQTYGLLLSQEAIIMEENVAIPLHKRIGIMTQVLIGIDAIRRLWKAENERKAQAISKDIK